MDRRHPSSVSTGRERSRAAVTKATDPSRRETTWPPCPRTAAARDQGVARPLVDPRGVAIVPPASVIVPPAADGVSGGAEEHQDESDHHQDDPEGPQDRDARDEPDDRKDDSENDHWEPPFQAD